MTGAIPLVQSKVSLDLTALCLQCNLVQLVLVEDVHATRHESKVGISVGNCKDTKQDAFGVPAIVFRVSSLAYKVRSVRGKLTHARHLQFQHTHCLWYHNECRLVSRYQSKQTTACSAVSCRQE